MNFNLTEPEPYGAGGGRGSKNSRKSQPTAVLLLFFAILTAATRAAGPYFNEWFGSSK